jgi:hypothetical protein
MARSATSCEVRPVMIASSTPERFSIFMPWPSRELKALNSWPSSAR